MKDHVCPKCNGTGVYRPRLAKECHVCGYEHQSGDSRSVCGSCKRRPCSRCTLDVWLFRLSKMLPQGHKRARRFSVCLHCAEKLKAEGSCWRISRSLTDLHRDRGLRERVHRADWNPLQEVIEQYWPALSGGEFVKHAGVTWRVNKGWQPSRVAAQWEGPAKHESPPWDQRCGNAPQGETR
jgi:hypothetical protein